MKDIDNILGWKQRTTSHEIFLDTYANLSIRHVYIQREGQWEQISIFTHETKLDQLSQYKKTIFDSEIRGYMNAIFSK